MTVLAHINWSGVVAVSSPVLTLVGWGTNWLGKKLSKLDERLETQDKAKLSFEKAVSEEHKELGERVARLEGPVAKVAAILPPTE